MNITRKIKSHEIAEAIYREIQENGVSPDTPVMSTTRIAEHYNVCLMTAHKALNHLEEQNLIYRVKGKGSFVKKNEQPETKLNIGCAFLEHGHNQDSKHEILMGTFPDAAMKYFQSQGCVCRLIPYVFFNDPQYWKGLDGVLVSVNLIDDSTIGILRNAGIPVMVFQGETERELPFDQVVPDHTVALEELLAQATPEHYSGVITLFHKHPNGTARAEAFLNAARRAGFEDIRIEQIDDMHEDGFRRGLKLAEHCRGKLIFSCSDLLTFGIVDALRENGLEFGRDYGIVGYDNLEAKGIMPYKRPVITAMDYSCGDAASVAAELLLLNIRQKKNYRQIIKIPTRLTIRESALKFNTK